MKGHNDDNIIKVVFKRLFEMVAQICIIFALYSALSSLYSNQYFLTVCQFLGWTGVIVITVYYIHSIVAKIKEFRETKERYERVFLNKKVCIGYEVGSFWEVVDRYRDEEEVAIVLGVNNRFCLDNDYLSKSSLVYQYMQLLSDHEKQKIYENIQKYLGDKIIGYNQNNRPIYEYGSMVVMHPTEEIPYEVALISMCEPSASNLPGKFSSTREALIESFEKLFEQMPNVFTESTLIVPLIGTKSSGSPLSHEEVAKYLISAFANYSRVNEQNLARRLVVSLYDKDFKEMDDLMKIKRHIDMECAMGDFSYSKIKSEITGKYGRKPVLIEE